MMKSARGGFIFSFPRLNPNSSREGHSPKLQTSTQGALCASGREKTFGLALPLALSAKFEELCTVL